MKDIIYPSATKAFLAGAWRGAKFGGKWMGMILGGVAVVVCLIVCLAPGPEGPCSPFVSFKLSLYACAVLGVAYGTIPAALIGALIMGVGEGMSYCREKKKSETATTM